MVGWWIELCSIDYHVRGVYSVRGLCCLGWRFAVDASIYLSDDFCCFVVGVSYLRKWDDITKFKRMRINRMDVILYCCVSNDD